MRWVEALSTETELSAAIKGCAEALGEIPEGGFDLVFVFASPTYPDVVRLGEWVAEAVPCRHVIGCTGGGIIGGGREIESSAAVSLLAARLPDVAVVPFHLTTADLENLPPGPGAWEDRLGVPRGGGADFVVLADPFSFLAEALTQGIDYAYPGARVVGGLASGGEGPGQNHLFLDGQAFTEGAVGVAVSGDIAVETVVAQGVRPVGPTYLVTRAERQLLFELDGQPVMSVLESFFAGLSPEEMELAGRALFLGISQRADNDSPEHGDFLIRNLLGVVQEQGALAIGERLREGQLVRFHVRDAATSSEDLALLLSGYAHRRGSGGPAGALLFSCLGRGRSLYGESDHDSRVFRDLFGPVSMGGFFCNGEIGPVGDATYLHGYTSSFALFHPGPAS